MTAGIWTDEVRVRSYDVTPQGTASVLALADYFQEAAGRHAAELGVSMTDLRADGQAWVLAFMHMQIERLPHQNESIRIETWPSGLESASAHREFVFHDEEGAMLAGGTSRWFVFDVDRRRPVRPPRVLADIEGPDRPGPIDQDLDALPAPVHTDREQTFTARYHDLDLNRHVNNVRYLEWALETLPAAVLDERRCLGFAVQFEAETRLGDPVRASAEQIEDGGTLRVRHRLAQAESDQTLALVRTTWL
ncbi:acyl-[acyl-carrier-protein] thioesterase [Salinibacter sp.]|uniref:acyl-[acyl-carrier-protein] thioesterase n=1 Tax=Salinibacter sp. TaxID=2065818 RepID=UPI0021E97ED0|nr:acyl-ACP thioesterase domain-containing protein [Salinibacter sp.]